MARGKTTPSGGPAQSAAPGPSPEYGQGVANAQAMKAVPLPKLNTPPAIPKLNVPGAMPSGQAPAGPPSGANMADQAPMPQPGSLGGLTDPSTDTNPITHGASFGAGADMSQLAINPKPAAPPPGPQIDAAFMVNYLPILESRASQPDSSFALRAWVRKLRSSLPADFDPTHLQSAQPSADQSVGLAKVPADPALHTAPAPPPAPGG